VVAALLVAAAVAGVVVWQPWASGGHAAAGSRPSTHPGTSAKAPGPAALPTAPLLVRTDTAPGWPDSCHAVIALRDAADDRPRRIVDGGTCDVLPVWAPDGKRFAFTRVSPDRTSAAWVANADGTGARRVAATAGGRVSWSPDGSRLAVVRRKDGVLQIFTVSVADGSATQVTTGHQDTEDPAWSPDGSRMALCRQTEPGLWQVFVLDLTAGATTPRQVTHGTRRALTPQWSPDGRRLVYVSGKPGEGTQGDIRVIGADGTGDRPLAATADQEMDPVWSHDGTWVAYVRGPIPTPAVWAVRADGTGARPLTTGTVPEGHPSWR
jgi:Tol biopolymer transport system component